MKHRCDLCLQHACALNGVKSHGRVRMLCGGYPNDCLSIGWIANEKMRKEYRKKCIKAPERK